MRNVSTAVAFALEWTDSQGTVCQLANPLHTRVMLFSIRAECLGGQMSDAAEVTNPERYGMTDRAPTRDEFRDIVQRFADEAERRIEARQLEMIAARRARSRRVDIG